MFECQCITNSNISVTEGVPFVSFLNSNNPKRISFKLFVIIEDFFFHRSKLARWEKRSASPKVGWVGREFEKPFGDTNV